MCNPHLTGYRRVSARPSSSLLRLFPWVALVIATAPTQAGELSVVQSVTATSEQVTLVLSTPAMFRRASLPADAGRGLPDRCYVDISPAALGNQVRSFLEVHTGLVQRIRTAQFDPDTVRVVLDLLSTQPCWVSAATGPDRLLITLGAAPGSEVKAPAAATAALPAAPLQHAVRFTAPAAAPAQPQPAVSSLAPPHRTAAATPRRGDQPVASPEASNHTGHPQESRPSILLSQAQENTAPVAAQPIPSPPSAATTTSEADTPMPTLALEDAYRLALANEEQIKIAGHELAKAQLLPWRALAQLTPRADVTGTYTRNKEEIAFVRPDSDTGSLFGGTTSTIRPLETWQGIFAVTQPLIQPSFLPSWRLGKNSIRQSLQQYGFTMREVLFAVARAYYDVLRAQQQVRVTQDTLQLARDELRHAQVRFRVGEVTKTDVLRAEVEVARNERILVTNQNNLQLALKVLARAMGTSESFRVVEPTPRTFMGETYEQLLQKAYSQRQDVRAQEAAIEVARQRANLVRARYFPQVNAQWQFPRLNPETFAQRDEFWTLFLNFQVPIFDGGTRELDLQEQHENLAQVELQLGRLRKDVSVEVKQALLAVETSGAILETLKKEVALAQENYTITSKQYRVGWSTSLDVNTALNVLNQVRTQLADQTYAYQVALLGLDRVVGQFAQDYLPRH